tara:strand:+ start:507 stop:737 length:231 start_codon:yes stop_codon:yes gene_type:complete
MVEDCVNSVEFKNFVDALSWLMSDILSDGEYLSFEYDESLSTVELLAASEAKSEKLEQALMMLATACQWADKGSKQ